MDGHSVHFIYFCSQRRFFGGAPSGMPSFKNVRDEQHFMRCLVIGGTPPVRLEALGYSTSSGEGPPLIYRGRRLSPESFFLLFFSFLSPPLF
jgi:hypothetical protein